MPSRNVMGCGCFVVGGTYCHYLRSQDEGTTLWRSSIFCTTTTLFFHHDRHNSSLWWCCVNMHGIQGRNIACDLHMEHLNRLCKDAVCGLGANKTPNAIIRMGKCIVKLSDFLDHYDITSVSSPSGKHAVISSTKDRDLILTELNSKACFRQIPKRKHASFKSVKSSILSKANWNSGLRNIKLYQAHSYSIHCVLYIHAHVYCQKSCHNDILTAFTYDTTNITAHTFTRNIRRPVFIKIFKHNSLRRHTVVFLQYPNIDSSTGRRGVR